MSQKQFERLFQPGRIGSMEVKNRLVMPPMATSYSLKDGSVTDRQIDYYEERAKGGVGLVIVEIACVDSPVGKGTVRQIVIDDDRFIPGLSRLAEAIKRQGPRAAIQIHHAGRQTSSKWTGHQPVAPSPIPVPGGEQPRELTLSEIARLVFMVPRVIARLYDPVREDTFHTLGLMKTVCPTIIGSDQIHDIILGKNGPKSN